MIFIFVILLKVCSITSVELDVLDCGTDSDNAVSEGDVPISKYPWLGVLIYEHWGGNRKSREVATVTLIHREFVIGSAAVIGHMPKRNFRKHARVLLGEGWNRRGRRVQNYILHPEYIETVNTICLIQLKDIVSTLSMRPLCAPPKLLMNPELYIVKIKSDLQSLDKKVVKAAHVPGKMCKNYYANLHSKTMSPSNVGCASVVRTNEIRLRDAGAALVARDEWGRWQLLGIGVSGPRRRAPSRFFDIMTYYPWIQKTFSKFQQIVITRINHQTYVLRAAPDLASPVPITYQRFGNCHPEEKKKLLFRELTSLRNDNHSVRFLTHNMSIRQQSGYSCLTMKLKKSTAVSEMHIKHRCKKTSKATCHRFESSRFDISVQLMIAGTSVLEIEAWSYDVNRPVIDTWKRNKGTYYKDFGIQPEEHKDSSHFYKSPKLDFKPVGTNQWGPKYDIWPKTKFDNSIIKAPSLQIKLYE